VSLGVVLRFKFGNTWSIFTKRDRKIITLKIISTSYFFLFYDK
jgi:hypothetical protein